MIRRITLIAACAIVTPSGAQTAGDPEGLKRHPFLYCGEYEKDADQQTIHLIRGGQQVWSHKIKFRVMRGGKPDIQELGDCTRLSSGNIIFTTRFGAAEITPDKTIVWQYIAPDGTEIHSLQPLGRDRVLLAQNGKPALALVIDKPTNTIVQQLEVPVAKPDEVHGQMRRVRMTAAGNWLVAHMDKGTVVEYDSGGKPVWSVDVLSPWGAVRLKNGNTLISSNKGFVREVTPAGITVWEYGRAEAKAAGIDLYNVQEAQRLANGNTVFTNWVASAMKPEEWAGTVQALEVTLDKRVVWKLSSWSKPRLGPATSIQLLDEPGVPEDGALQR
ncbi:beta-propeller domain-containing protein [Sphingomonas sp. RS2018]